MATERKNINGGNRGDGGLDEKDKLYSHCISLPLRLLTYTDAGGTDLDENEERWI